MKHHLGKAYQATSLANKSKESKKNVKVVKPSTSFQIELNGKLEKERWTSVRSRPKSSIAHHRFSSEQQP